MADNVTGIVLDIPADVLNNIKNADKVIKDLEQTSKKAAQNIKRDFGTTMVSGVEAFIKKVQEAQTTLKGLKIPNLNLGGNLNSEISKTSSSVSQLVQDFSRFKSAVIDTSAQAEKVRLLREQYEQMRNALNAMAQRNYNIKVDLDKSVEGEIKRINDQIAALRKSNLQLGAKGDTSAIQANLTAIKQLEKELDKIKNAQVDLLRTDKSRAEFDALQKRVSLVFTELQKAQRQLAADNALNAALERQKQTIANYANEIQKLDAQLARLNAQGKMFNADGTYSTQAIALLQQRATLEKQITAAQTTGKQAQIQYEKQLADEQKRRQQEAIRAAKEQAEAEKQSRREIAQAAKEQAKAEREAKTAATRLAREQAKAEREAAREALRLQKEAAQSLANQKRLTLASPTGAMDYAKNARSLRDLQAAYKNLKAVMATVDPKSSAWQQMNTVLGQTRTRIDEIKKSMGEFKSHASQVGDVAGQLKRTLAAAFSISAITGYINKLIETRAQFELQQTALRAILQDKQKADQIFQQVQQMALQSPFSIMQMTTFTKQLAAYRIESEKLVGTTKMLADVSAGLGVDMGRLILAYGQVKAANYLRATEVRQFTEAGLNIAGELATYFSELQGKMISVGDVMEMITKRMVRFEDVEEVFKRVTSAGGLFYDMQKKQSETLWGQLQRIKDAMSIMFNEIGKSNQGAISNVLTLIRSLINHWRMLAPIITTVGGAMATVLAVQGIKAFISSLRTMGAAVATLALKWKGVESEAAAAAVAERGAAMATGIGLAVTAVTLLTGVLIGAWQEAHKLDEEFERISEESSKDMWDLIFKFREGADAVRDTTKSYEERQKALEDLQNTFRGILPDQDLEYNNIIRITDGYKSATEAIKAYSAEKAKQTAQEAIETEKQTMYGGLIKDAKDLFPFIQGAFDSLENASDAAVKGLIGNIMLQIQEETEKGMIKSAEQGYNRFIEIMTQRFGNLNNSAAATGLRNGLKTIFGVDGWFDKPKDDFEEYLTFMTDKQQEFAKQFQVTYEDMTQQDIDNFANYKKTYEERAKVLGNFQAKLLAYQEARKNGDIDAQGNATNEAGQRAIADLEEVVNTINNFTGLTDEAKISWDELKKSTDYETDALVYFDGVQKSVLGSFLQNIINAGGNKSIVNWAEETNKSLRNAGFQEMQLDIANTAKKWGLLSGVSSAVMNKIKIDANTNYNSAAKDAKALSDEAQQNILKINQTATSLIDMGLAANKAQAMAMSEKQWGTTIEDEQKTVKWASELAKLWGQIDKVDKKSNRQKDIWTPRLNLMQKVNKEYEKLLKYYSKEEAMARIRTSYGDAVAEAFKSTQWADISKWGTFDAQATIDRLKQLAKRAGKDAKKKILEAVGTLQAEIDIKIEEKNIQEAKDKIQSLFDNYELTKTLGGLGLNIDLTYLVGGKPVKLEDLRKQLEQELSTVKATGGEEDTVKAYEDALRKVTDMENKAAVERLKNYSKYLTMMYSDRAKAMIESYTTMKDMEKDFADYRKQLEKEAADPATSEQRKKEISQQISMLETQARDAIKGVKNDLNSSLNKLDWEAFKGSPVFTQMYSDLETLSKKGIDLLISKLTTMRDKLQAMDNVDYRAVREITKYIEKLNTQRIEVDSWKELNAAIKEANALRKEGNNMDKAQSELMSEQANLDAANAEIANLQTIINLKQQEGTEKSKTKNLSADQLKLYDLSEDKLQEMLSTAQDNANAAQANILKWSGVVSTLQKGKKALEEQSKRIKMLHDNFDKVFDSAIDLADALGADTEIWGDFAKGVVDSIFQVILLTIQLKIMGIAANSALGVIGYIAIALQVVASLLASIFRAGDKRKEKQIQRLQYKVEDLQKAYEKLQTAIEEAYSFDDYNAGYNQSMRNLQEQRAAIQEQLALEKSKKKSDKDKIREYEDALDELKEKEKELRESRYEAMGSVGEKGIRTEAENFVSAWLDAYKETGDGLDALKEHWNEFFETLVLKQAASAVVSRRMKKYVDQINAAIDSGVTGLSLSQTFAQIGQNLKSELGAWNEDLKAFFDAVGIKGGQGELLLSDLQKGIQNITEPQAAAIEAYLNSMRFAVFEQNNILTNMLAAIQAQYGSNDNSSMLQEVRAIRSLVSSIDDKLSRVVVSRSSQNTNYIVKVG